MIHIGMDEGAGPSGLKALFHFDHALTGVAIEYRPFGPKWWVIRSLVRRSGDDFMKRLRKSALTAIAALAISCSFVFVVVAQDRSVVLTGADLTRVVPPGFYFQGLTAPTQIRNSAAARFGAKRYVIAGMVDTSGYAADVRARYEGFLITDSPITINGSDLGVGAYGFGFSNDGKLNILDLAGNEILSVSTTKDSKLKRPRPLMMTGASDGIRFYGGREYAVIAAK